MVGSRSWPMRGRDRVDYRTIKSIELKKKGSKGERDDKWRPGGGQGPQQKRGKEQTRHLINSERRLSGGLKER